MAEADGTEAEALATSAELAAVLGERATAVAVAQERHEIAALWRWRDGVSIAVTARRGGKVSEDIVVPPERLLEAIEATEAIGERPGLETCSWGHAGGGNVHSTFMIDTLDPEELARTGVAAQELFAAALALGGSISGEHGIGIAKRGWLELQWQPAAVEAARRVKAALDPKGLLNPGKLFAATDSSSLDHRSPG